MNKAWPWLLALPLEVAGCGSGGPETAGRGGEPACAAPLTTVADSTVAPGQTVRVAAEGLWSSCRDHALVDEDGTEHDPEPEPAPLTSLPVRWTQGETVVDLAVVDAGPSGSAELDVTIPADAEAGPAELAIGHRSSPAALTVVTEEASPRTSR